jgi:threonine/homoserine/homoserine lactone efflux protein
LWIGLRMLLARSAPTLPALATEPKPRSLPAVFRGGFLTNALNPKVAIFFLAFVPQFIEPNADNKALDFVLLGLLFNLNSIPVNSAWAVAAAWLARREAVQRGMHWLDRIAACMFIGFGVKLALTDNPSI